MRKIILLGYMASGKTTVAQLLSENLQIPAVDLDKLIEEKEKASVSEIFSRHGEIYFRKMEHQCLKDLLAKTEPMILSLGGGTPCYANNHLIINGEENISVYLKASIATLMQRLESNHKRPLLDNLDHGQKQEFIAKHLFDRSYYYNQARYIINVDDKTPEEVAKEISFLT